MVELAPLLVSTLVLGLLGGGHCLDMHGGLMGVLTLAIPAEQRGRHLRLPLAYDFGRILSYACAGPLLDLVDWAVTRTPLVDALRVAAGLLLIVMGLYLTGQWGGLTRVETLGRSLWHHLEPFARRLLPVPSLPRTLLLGTIWGWLPYRLAYSTLLWAINQGSTLGSALLTLAFGLGTWPVPLVTGMTAEQVIALLRHRSVRIMDGLMVVLFDLWILPGPHQAWLMGH